MSKSPPLDKHNPEETLRNSLNNSISKMQYSFTKSNRFLPDTKEKSPPFYNIPSIRDKRSTSFGYGTKTSFEDRKGVPAPNNYFVISEFLKDTKNGFSFGMSRQVVKNVTVFRKSDVPGPGAYEPKSMIHEPSYSIKKRIPDTSLLERIKTPGPGTYEVPVSISKNGRYSVSKYQNCKCPVITRANERVKTEQTPGPAAYAPKVLNNRGQRLLTETLGRRFPTSKRLGIYMPSDTPGPGQYERFSDFIK